MIRSFTLAMAAMTLVAFAAGSAIAAPPKTLDNLMAAYNGESNAKAKYMEFAKKADQEGFAGAAALFRAAAKAEETHATRHAEVIKTLGGTPKAEITLPRSRDGREPEGGPGGRDLRARQDVSRVHRGSEGVREQGRAARVQFRSVGRGPSTPSSTPMRAPTWPLETGEDVLRVPGVRQDRPRRQLREVPGVLHARREVREGRLACQYQGPGITAGPS